MASSTEPPFDDSDAFTHNTDGVADESALIFNRYRLERELGRGGMGRVLLAYDTKLAIHVAVKVLPEAVIADAQAIDDLRGEVLRGIALNHGGIVRTHTFEMDASGAAIVMEFVDGWTLADLKQERPGACFDVTEILPWLGQLCEILDYAHREARIVHRDLKPRNLMLTRGGRLKIADFGISTQLSDAITRTTGTGPSSGTPAYMSPQQTLGKTPSHLDDIYALGATIYDLLTGRPPFFRGHVVAQVLDATPPPMAQRREELSVKEKVAIPRAWENTIAACLAKEPESRPQSAGEVLARLCEDDAEIIDSGEPNEAAPDAEPISAPRRYTAAAMAAAVVVGGGLLWISLATSHHRQSETHETVAKVTPASATPALKNATPSPAPSLASSTPRITTVPAVTPPPKNIPEPTPKPLVIIWPPPQSTPASKSTPAPEDTPASKDTWVHAKVYTGPVYTAPNSQKIDAIKVVIQPLYASKDNPFVNSLGMQFVSVLTGGVEESVLFSIWDTRVQDYEAFVRATGRPWNRPKFPQTAAHPAVNVSWEDAHAFCEWLTKLEHNSGKTRSDYAYRLPTDYEWSGAVGIGSKENPQDLPPEKAGRLPGVYPWGSSNAWPPPTWSGNYADEAAKRAQSGAYGYLIRFNDGFAYTSPVGSFRANSAGLYDLGGNVWQWCEDRIEPTRSARVLRGASYADSKSENLLSSARINAEPYSRGDAYGFRCVLTNIATDKSK